MSNKLETSSIFVREITADKECSYDAGEKHLNMNHHLLLKRLTIGGDVDPTQMCMVEMETTTDSGSKATFPLAFLRGNDMPQAIVDLHIKGKVTFRVAKGHGPVYLIGQCVLEVTDEAEDSEEEEEEEDDLDVDDEELSDEEEEHEEL